jgi:hypothetical protein
MPNQGQQQGESRANSEQAYQPKDLRRNLWGRAVSLRANSTSSSDRSALIARENPKLLAFVVEAASPSSHVASKRTDLVQVYNPHIDHCGNRSASQSPLGVPPGAAAFSPLMGRIATSNRRHPGMKLEAEQQQQDQNDTTEANGGDQTNAVRAHCNDQHISSH